MDPLGPGVIDRVLQGLSVDGTSQAHADHSGSVIRRPDDAPGNGGGGAAPHRIQDLDGHDLDGVEAQRGDAQGVVGLGLMFQTRKVGEEPPKN